MFTIIAKWRDGTTSTMELDVKETPLMEHDVFIKMLTKMAEDIVIQFIKDGDIPRPISDLVDVQLVLTDEN